MIALQSLVTPSEAPGSGAFWLALILAFSPWEKEEPSETSGFAEDYPAIAVASIRGAAEEAPSPWRSRAGVRSSLATVPPGGPILEERRHWRS
jgi:hypothetical protein